MAPNRTKAICNNPGWPEYGRNLILLDDRTTAPFYGYLWAWLADGEDKGKMIHVSDWPGHLIRVYD